MNWYEVLPGLVLLHSIMATAAVVTAFLSRKPRLGKIGLGLLLAVLTMQTSQLFVTLFFRSQPELLRADYFQGLIWMLAAMSYASWRSARFSSLCLILAPLTLVVTLGITNIARKLGRIALEQGADLEWGHGWLLARVMG